MNDTAMALIFEWDNRKAKQNFNKHDVSFEEAATVFPTHSIQTVKTVLSLLESQSKGVY